MIQAIVFDMGNVLASEGWGRLRLAEFDKLLGWEPGTLLRRMCSGPIWEAYSTGALSPEAYWAQVGAPLQDRLPSDFVKFRDNFYGAELDRTMVDLAWRLRKHYRIALLSNATPLLSDGLLQDPLLQGLFHLQIISAQVGMRKPDPAIFHYTAQALDLPLSACVLIDDKLRNTRAAQAQGMQVIQHKDPSTTKQLLREMGVRLD